MNRKYKLLEMENSALAGHSNHQQRIQVLMRCKQERDEARQQVIARARRARTGVSGGALGAAVDGCRAR